MLRRYEDKMTRRRPGRMLPHEPHVRHGVDFVEICDGRAGVLCTYRPATAEERTRYRHARMELA